MKKIFEDTGHTSYRLASVVQVYAPEEDDVVAKGDKEASLYLLASPIYFPYLIRLTHGRSPGSGDWYACKVTLDSQAIRLAIQILDTHLGREVKEQEEKA